MANGQQNINYTAADFERYYNGSMMEAEMYALEKAALEDPFLSDALEGYALTATPAEDIRQLAALIPPKEQKKSRVVAFKTGWLRVAAILVLVFGIGYITLKTNKKQEPTQTLASADAKAVISPADEQYKKLIPDTASASSVTRDKIVTTQKADALPRSNSSISSANDHFDKIAPAPVQAQTYPPASVDDARSIQAEKDFSAAQAKQESELVKKMYQKPGQQYFLQGKVTDDDGSPVQFATVSGNNNTATMTDADGNFSLQSKDSLLLANISASGYAAVNQNFNLNTTQNITLKKESAELSEAIVTSAAKGYSTKKSVPQEVVQAKNNSISIQPVDGMAKYDQYLDSARRLPTVTKAPGGQVTLSFKVNKKGDPVDVQVVKPLSSERDKEAIRLLKEGPKWEYSNGRRTSKSFDF